MAKDPQQSLKDWSAQKWMTSGTYANKKKGSSKEVKSKGKKRYLPEAAWGSLSAGKKQLQIKQRLKVIVKENNLLNSPRV
jgi:hypothetical protein